MGQRNKVKEYDGPVSYGGGGPDGSDTSGGYVPTYAGVPAGGSPTQASPPPPAGGQYYYAATPAVYAEPLPQFYYPATPAYAVNPGAWAPQPPQGVYASPPQAQPPPGPGPGQPTFGAKEAGWKIPKGGDYTDTIVLSPTIRAEQASTQGPCPIVWDLRRPTSSASVSSASGVNPELAQNATHPPVRSMTIVCKQIPWTITIKKYSVIRCKDVIDAVYAALQEKMTIPEYFIASSEKRKIMDAVNERETENPRSKRRWIVYKDQRGKEKRRAGDRFRIDYLDQLVLFKGLYHDPDLIADRLAHDPDAQEDAWVMSLGFSAERLM